MEQLLDISNALSLIEEHLNQEQLQPPLSQSLSSSSLSLSSDKNEEINKKRNKRDILSPILTTNSSNTGGIDQISNVIQEIQKTLESLEEKFLEHDNLSTTRSQKLNAEKIAAKCFIESSGKVNCSDIIYEDERIWKKSRQQIDMLIKVLKDKINYLKDIKKHLRENKPSPIRNGGSDLNEDNDYLRNRNGDGENSGVSNNDEFDGLSSSKKINRRKGRPPGSLNYHHQQQQQHHHSSHHHNHGRHKKKTNITKYVDTNNNDEGTLIDMSYFRTDRNEIPSEGNKNSNESFIFENIGKSKKTSGSHISNKHQTNEPKYNLSNAPNFFDDIPKTISPFVTLSSSTFAPYRTSNLPGDYSLERRYGEDSVSDKSDAIILTSRAPEITTVRYNHEEDEEDNFPPSSWSTVSSSTSDNDFRITSPPLSSTSSSSPSLSVFEERYSTEGDRQWLLSTSSTTLAPSETSSSSPANNAVVSNSNDINNNFRGK